MLSFDPKLKNAYYIMQKYQKFNAESSFEDAKEKFDTYLDLFLKSNIPEFQDFAKTLKEWKKEIINSFIKIDDKRISNAYIERLNEDIKTIIRLAHGINFEVLRKRTIYVCNSKK